MKGAIALRKPVGVPAAIDTATTNVTNSAYVQIIAALAMSCSGLQVSNAGSQALAIAVGAAGQEKLTGALIPPGQAIIIPIEILAGQRVSVKSLGATQSAGVVSMATFQ